MNLAQIFSYTRALERKLKLQISENAILERALNTAQAERRAAESTAAARGEELERVYAELKELRAQNLALIDRLVLQHRSVPISEPLKRDTVESQQTTQNYVDMARRRTGPVAAARQNAETAFHDAQAEEMAQRARLSGNAARAAVTSAAANAEPFEDLSDLLQE